MSVTSIQLLSCVWWFGTPRTVACPASLSITNSWSLCLLLSQFYYSSYFLFDEAVQSCICCGCTDSCSLTLIPTDSQQYLFSLTCSQKVCSTSLLLRLSLWIMYLTGISGNPWFSDFQCKPSSHPSPLLSISVFPALGVHFTLDREKFRDHHTEWRRVDSSYIMGCNGEVGYKNPQQWAPTQR